MPTAATALTAIKKYSAISLLFNISTFYQYPRQNRKQHRCQCTESKRAYLVIVVVNENSDDNSSVGHASKRIEDVGCSNCLLMALRCLSLPLRLLIFLCSFSCEVTERCLADSNRRAWFCRPVTQPLIQGTIVLLNADANVQHFFELPTIRNKISYFFSFQGGNSALSGGIAA